MTAAIVRTGDGRPLRVALEGLCGAGKSTLAAALAPCLDALLVPEYADLAPLPPWPPACRRAARAGLEQLAAVERERQRTAADSGRRAVVFDRCPLSLAAHEAGMRALGTPADVTYAARRFDTCRVPDAVLYLAVPEPVALERLRARGPMPAHLIEPVVRAAMADYYAAALARVPGRVLQLDGALPLPRLLHLALDFVHDLGEQPVLTWRLPGFAAAGWAA